MQTRRNILRRIRGLYFLFFTVLLASLLFTVSGTEFLTSLRDAVREQKELLPDRDLKHFFSIPNKTQDYDHDLPMDTRLEDTGVSGRITSMDITVAVPEGERLGSWSTVVANLLFGISVLAYLVIFVVVLLIINSLRKSIKSEILFDRRNVALVRTIGFLLIVASVCGSFFNYLENRFLAQFVSSPVFTVDTSLHLAFGELIMGILILFIAEVFAIGYDMSEEQKLTI